MVHNMLVALGDKEIQLHNLLQALVVLLDVVVALGNELFHVVVQLVALCFQVADALFELLVGFGGVAQGVFEARGLLGTGVVAGLRLLLQRGELLRLLLELALLLLDRVLELVDGVPVHGVGLLGLGIEVLLEVLQLAFELAEFLREVVN